MTAQQNKALIGRMVDALNDYVIDGQEEFWHADAKWRGPAGAGVKPSLKSFQDGWQRPFREAFAEKRHHDQVHLADGDFVATFGHSVLKHTGDFMGLQGDGREIELRYMDFWRLKDGKIAENWVLLDIIHVFRQHGIDLLNGKGWDDRL